jgi:hypothetical protein
MSERQYTDEEVAAIFARATELQNATPLELPATTGMSLAQLQEIGREAGIPAEFVAEAARAVDRPAPPRDPKLLGLTLGVSHTVELGRWMTDEEWERFVVELRETFDARGKIQYEGSFRSWSNGNLQVMLEPSDDGHRVRFRTVRAEARGLLMIGLGLISVSATIVVVALTTTEVPLMAAVSSVMGMGLVGVGMFASAAVRLPGWAKLRREQMQRLGGKLLSKPLLKP